MTKLSIKILGCGSSIGAPVPGCCCSTCASSDKKNQRMRTSIFVKFDNYNILIDTGPDLKKQMLDNKLNFFDLVLYTHFHGDHTFGIHDLILSVINTKEPLNIFGNQELIDALHLICPHLFIPINNPHINSSKNSKDPIFQPTLISNIIKNYDQISLNEKLFIRCFEQNHGKIKSIGYEFFGKFAYSPDFYDLPQETIDFLKSLHLELWILPLTLMRGNKTHIGYDRMLDLVKEISPKRVILIHMGHSIEFNEIKELLKDSIVEPGFDGMEIDLY